MPAWNSKMHRIPCKKWWVEADFKAPNLPLSLRLKGSGCHYNSIYRFKANTIESDCKIMDLKTDILAVKILES
jgi:hypothetical protein